MQGYGHQLLVSMSKSEPRPPWLPSRPLLLPDGALVDEAGVTLFNSLQAVQAQLDQAKQVIGDAKTAIRDAKELLSAFNVHPNTWGLTAGTLSRPTTNDASRTPSPTAQTSRSRVCE